MSNIKKLVTICSAISAAVSTTMLYLAVQHNAQGEFINLDTGAIDYAYLALIFSSWFVATLIVQLIVVISAKFIITVILNKTNEE